MNKLCFLFILFPFFVSANEFHVSKIGSDKNDGSSTKPFKTIMRAASVAMPGDTITVYAGIYRESIDPPRGGFSENSRIVYRASPQEKVIISGAERIGKWQKIGKNLWKSTIPNRIFRAFNPYIDTLHGDWFNSNGKKYHTGALYIDDKWLPEIETFNKLNDQAKGDGAAGWYSEVRKNATFIYASFKSDPNAHITELNVRQVVFYPTKVGINYLTVQGFELEKSATPWAPPTAEQRALIGTNWSKGWIIENNIIKYSRCAGLSLGKYGDEFDNAAPTAEAYLNTIERARTNGWGKAKVGSHLIRNNDISYCGQAGIVGSLGGIFSRITGNTIHDIYVQREFSGAEMAGLKLHGAVDVLIDSNHIYNSHFGIWLDWMAQGCRVSRNLLHDNDAHDVFVEVSFGPYILDNNILLSASGLAERSQGGALVHNLIAGKVTGGGFERRKTPVLKPHSCEILDTENVLGGDMRFMNNIFYDEDVPKIYAKVMLYSGFSGNIFVSKDQVSPVISKNTNGYYLKLKLDEFSSERTSMVTTHSLGKNICPGQYFENSDESEITFNMDFFGNRRDEKHPAPGPFKNASSQEVTLSIWVPSKM